MFLVKLLILMIIFTALYYTCVTFVVKNLPFKRRMEISLGKDPTWLDICTVIFAFLVFLDVILFVYSVIFLLFFR